MYVYIYIYTTLQVITHPIDEEAPSAGGDEERISVVWVGYNVADISVDLAVGRGAAAIVEDIGVCCHTHIWSPFHTCVNSKSSQHFLVNLKRDYMYQNF